MGGSPHLLEVASRRYLIEYTCTCSFSDTLFLGGLYTKGMHIGNEINQKPKNMSRSQAITRYIMTKLLTRIVVGGKTCEKKH